MRERGNGSHRGSHSLRSLSDLTEIEFRNATLTDVWTGSGPTSAAVVSVFFGFVCFFLGVCVFFFFMFFSKFHSPVGDISVARQRKPTEESINVIL